MAKQKSWNNYYEIIDELGEGGNAKVYRVKCKEDNEEYALKDLFVGGKEKHSRFVNEINTIPGSLAFYLWQASGVSFEELMDKLVELALERERRRSRMTFSYSTNLLETYSESGAKGAKGAKQ